MRSWILPKGQSCMSPDVVFTVVDSIGEEEIEKARKIAESCGVRLRVRSYIDSEDEG